MTFQQGRTFAEKHGPGTPMDPSIKEEVLKRAKQDELPCTIAFQIAKDLQVSPAKVGMTADLLNVRLIKCQLGLFGYAPRKRLVKKQSSVDPKLKEAILAGLMDGRLPCRTAWQIAARFSIGKLSVSAACETLQIKIKPCQLGAF